MPPKRTAATKAEKKTSGDSAAKAPAVKKTAKRKPVITEADPEEAAPKAPAKRAIKVKKEAEPKQPVEKPTEKKPSRRGAASKIEEEKPAEKKSRKAAASAKTAEPSKTDPQPEELDEEPEQSEEQPIEKKKARGRAATAKTKDKAPVAKAASEEPSEPPKADTPSEELDEGPDESEEQPIEKKKTRGRAATAKTKDKAPVVETAPEEPAETKTSRKRGAPSKSKNVPASAGSEPVPAKKTKTVANATVTPWDDLDFGCSKTNPEGKAANYHITTWNVAGVQAWLKKGGLDILSHDNPDVLCLQETKCNSEKIPEELKSVPGYKDYWCSSKKEGYAGVGILTKVMPIEVFYGIDDEEQDEDGRCITAEFKNFYLVNVYVPNAGRKLVTLPKRLKWNAAFKAYIKKLDETKPVIICGDMNVAHTEIDLANPKTNQKNAGFTVEEREGMTDFLGGGYVDTFRHLYPEETGCYTFWTYMSNARSKNVGWRLDYFLVSSRYVDRVCDNVIRTRVLGSDHAPVTLFMYF